MKAVFFSLLIIAFQLLSPMAEAQPQVSSESAILSGEERALRELASYFCTETGEGRSASCVDEQMRGLELIKKVSSPDGLWVSYQIRIPSAGMVVWKLTYRNGELTEITLVDQGSDV